MNILSVDPTNIAGEHICCAISDKKCQGGVVAKKRLIESQYSLGYRFKKLDTRGKVFIEYVPAEHSWLPVDADGYMFTNCFWVSGHFKGQGWGKALLAECERDAADRKGIVAVTGKKKEPFMSDPKFLKGQGFEAVDEAAPHFILWCKSYDATAEAPRFLASAKSGECEHPRGLAVYYSDFCPFTGYWNNEVLPGVAESRGLPLTLVKINSREEGRRS